MVKNEEEKEGPKYDRWLPVCETGVIMNNFQGCLRVWDEIEQQGEEKPLTPGQPTHRHAESNFLSVTPPPRRGIQRQRQPTLVRPEPIHRRPRPPLRPEYRNA